MPELSRFLRVKGGWEPQSSVVRKGRGEFQNNSIGKKVQWDLHEFLNDAIGIKGAMGFG